MQKLPNQQTEHIHEGVPSMPDSLAKDAAKYAQKSVSEGVQDEARRGGDAGTYNPNTDCSGCGGIGLVGNIFDTLECPWCNGTGLADEAKQEHERIAK